MNASQQGLVEGKAGYVTGAASGIGRGIALELAKEGAAVVVSDLEMSEEAGLRTVRTIEEAGGRAAWVPADVSSSAGVQNLVKQTVETFGSVDYAVNNAGIAKVGRIADMSEEDFDKVLAVNLKGTFLGLKHTIPVMLEAGGGAIVNMSSVAGLVASDTIGAYAATKHGVIGLTKAAANEYSGRGVRVNAIAPNAIRTALWEKNPPEFNDGLIAPQAMKRPGEPEEVGFVVASLISDRSGFVTGVTLPVDGGYLTGPAAE